jgi:hypothetical protein
MMLNERITTRIGGLVNLLFFDIYLRLFVSEGMFVSTGSISTVTLMQVVLIILKTVIFL